MTRDGASSSRSADRRAEWRNRLGLLLASTLLSLIVLEGALRFLAPESTNINHMPTLYQPDPEMGYRYVPGGRSYIQRLEFRGEVEINSDGFFDSELPQARRAGVARVVTLGDSFVAGLEAGRGRNYPDQLENLLGGSGGHPTEVFNLGMDGIGTLEAKVIFERYALAYEPDVVLVSFYRNDIWDVTKGIVHRDVHRGYVLIYRTEAQRAELAAEVDRTLAGGRGLLRAAIQRSYLLRALWTQWRHRIGWPWLSLSRNIAKAEISGSLSREQALAEIADLVESMARLCEARGCRLALVAIPTRDEAESDQPWRAQGLLEQLASRGVATLSLLEPFRERSAAGEVLYWRYDAHCNTRGYALIASEVARFLDREGWLQHREETTENPMREALPEGPRARR